MKSRGRSETIRTWPERERRPLPQRRPQLEPWNEKTRDHLRTYVLHEHLFACQGKFACLSQYSFQGEPETRIRRRSLATPERRGRADLAARPLNPVQEGTAPNQNKPRRRPLRRDRLPSLSAVG